MCAKFGSDRTTDGDLYTLGKIHTQTHTLLYRYIDYRTITHPSFSMMLGQAFAMHVRQSISEQNFCFVELMIESIPDRREPYRRVPIGRVHLDERRLDEVQ